MPEHNLSALVVALGSAVVHNIVVAVVLAVAPVVGSLSAADSSYPFN